MHRNPHILVNRTAKYYRQYIVLPCTSSLVPQYGIFLLTPPSEPRSGRSFRRPPLDGSLTIPEIYDWHWHHNPDHPIFVYPKGQRLDSITFAKLVPAVHRAGRVVANALDLDLHTDSLNFPVVAIVATSGT